MSFELCNVALEKLLDVGLEATMPEQKVADDLIARAGQFALDLNEICQGSLLKHRDVTSEQIIGPHSEFDRIRKAALEAALRINIEQRVDSPNSEPTDQSVSLAPNPICAAIKQMIGRLDDHDGLIWPLEEARDDVDRLLIDPLPPEIRTDLERWSAKLHYLLFEDEINHYRGSSLLLWCLEAHRGVECTEPLRKRLRQQILQHLSRDMRLIKDAATNLLIMAKSSVRPAEVPAASAGPNARSVGLPETTAAGDNPSAQPAPKTAAPTTFECEPVTAAERARLLELKGRIDPNDTYIGESLPILKVFDRIDKLNKAPSPSGRKVSPVLILGPTGAGKSAIAKLIHESSGRNGEFVHEQGADISGAECALAKSRWAGIGAESGLANVGGRGYPGVLSKAEGGTIFLDELANVPLDFQTFLLKILDGQVIPPQAGRGDPFAADVRLIFAMNIDPEEAVRTNRLKHDLFRRLRTWTVTIPSMRERTEDIISFAYKYAGDREMEEGFLLALLEYSWPGNVGELEDVMKVATARAGEAKKLGTLHLEFSDPEVVKALALSEAEAKKSLYSKLKLILEQQGLKKGAGLNKRIAAILKISESKVSRYFNAHLDS